MTWFAICLQCSSAQGNHPSTVVGRRLLDEQALTEAVKWREAILHRDLETVVAYAFPEHRDWIMKTEDRWWANIESLIER